MSHLCHAEGCDAECEPRFIMCGHHWRMVPEALKRDLYAVYVPGQEDRKDPTTAYLQVARKVVRHVASVERRRS